MNELLSAKSIVGGLVLVVTTMGIAYLSNTGRLPKWFVDAWIILAFCIGMPVYIGLTLGGAGPLGIVLLVVVTATIGIVALVVLRRVQSPSDRESD